MHGGHVGLIASSLRRNERRPERGTKLWPSQLESSWLLVALRYSQVTSFHSV